MWRPFPYRDIPSLQTSFKPRSHERYRLFPKVCVTALLGSCNKLHLSCSTTHTTKSRSVITSFQLQDNSDISNRNSASTSDPLYLYAVYEAVYAIYLHVLIHCAYSRTPCTRLVFIRIHEGNSKLTIHYSSCFTAEGCVQKRPTCF